MTQMKPRGLGVLLGALGLALGAVSIPSAMAGTAHKAQSAPADSVITGGQIGAAAKTPAAGDVWGTTWADDGNLYSVGDDAQGWPTGPACNNNFLIAQETGSPQTGATVPQLTGTNVNCMSGYGAAGAQSPSGGAGSLEKPPTNPAGYSLPENWKGVNTISIGGVLYASIARMIYQENGHRQYVMSSTIIKSTDHGETWTPDETHNRLSPMFSDQGFAPYFIQYGQDDNTQSTADGGDQYVYAVSNDGYYHSGSYEILGRVLRSKMGNLSGADWQFYNGGPGEQDSSWGTLDQAKPIIWNSHRISTTGAIYDAPLHMYVMMQWYWGFTYKSGSLQFSFNDSDWTAYSSPKPWGPWHPFWTHAWGPALTDPLGHSDTPGWYGAEFVPKFISPDGRHLVVFAASLFGGSAGNYGLTEFPFTINGG